MTEQAKCQHCGKAYAKKNLVAAPDGGAKCKDWFACAQRRDANMARRSPNRGRQGLRRVV